jgi:uncharacterized protein YndB with AHSA1/START domain
VSHNHVVVRATPDRVFDVLDDPCAYPRWVVGARRVRHVEPEWPGVGSRFFHALGAPGVELRDWTRILERERPRRVLLEVRFRPVGVARVAIDLTREATGTRVDLVEVPVSGPARALPRWLVEPLLGARNGLALWRLRREAERVSPLEHAARSDAA